MNLDFATFLEQNGFSNPQATPEQLPRTYKAYKRYLKYLEEEALV